MRLYNISLISNDLDMIIFKNNYVLGNIIRILINISHMIIILFNIIFILLIIFDNILEILNLFIFKIYDLLVNVFAIYRFAEKSSIENIYKKNMKILF